MRNAFEKRKRSIKWSSLQPNLLMGQRFLTSRSILKKIIDSAGLSPEDTVLEIGSGSGVLTLALAQKAGQVIAVEKDKRLFEFLEEKLRQEKIENVRLILGDILKIPNPYLPRSSRKSGLLRDSLTPIPYKVVANIPYYLIGRLLRLMLSSKHPPKEMYLMVQKEVAERITAKPPRMNLLALAVQAYGRPKILFQVPAGAFAPRPKVDSAFISITDIGRRFFVRNKIQEEKFFKIAQAAFRGKRKTLENSLSKNLKLPKSKLLEILYGLSLAGRRPEMLSLERWIKLIQQLP